MMLLSMAIIVALCLENNKEQIVLDKGYVYMRMWYGFYISSKFFVLCYYNTVCF